MNIVIYTKANCPNCVAAKQLLKSKGAEFTERDIDDPGELIAFSMMYPDIRQMPQIFINNQRVGGIAGLRVALTQMESKNAHAAV
jgi:glutaredoxin 3